METGVAVGGATEQFESSLVLFRNGDDRLAHQGARALLERAPGHVGGMMLLLATAGGCGDEQAVNDSLLEISGYFERMLAIPEVLELLQSELLAPVARSHTFRTLFAPALLHANHEVRERGGRELTGRLIEEAARDAAIEAALAEAPLAGTAPAMTCEAIHVVDMAKGETIANLRGQGPHLVGRDASAGVRLEDGFVSRKHLQLLRCADVWVAQSLVPTNPPELNGRAMGLLPVPLRHGDELRVGDAVLCVFSGLGDAVAPPDHDEMDLYVRTRPQPVPVDRPGRGRTGATDVDRRSPAPAHDAWGPDDRSATEPRPPPVRRPT